MKKRNLLQRSIIIAAVTLLGLYIVIGPHGRWPHFSDFKPAGIKATLAQNIHLGLDLKGGSHLVMRVMTDEYLKRLCDDNATAVQNAAKDKGFAVKEARTDTSGGNYHVLLQVADPTKLDEIRDAVEKKSDLGDRSAWTYSASGDTMTWALTAPAQRTLAEHLPIVNFAAQKVTVAMSARLRGAMPVPMKPPVLWNAEMLSVAPGSTKR